MEKKSVRLVLLVDDSDIDLFINRKVIELSGFDAELVTFKSGSEAISYIKDHQEAVNCIPDLILLDLNMPVFDGYQFLFEYSKLSETVRSKCKIVVLTSSNNERDREKIDVNTDVLHFLSKPLTEDKLNTVATMIAGV